MNRIFVLLILLLPAFVHLAFSQESSNSELHFEVNKIHPYISMTKEKLEEAHTLVDLNPHYKPSWVKAYTSVEVLAINNGKAQKALGKNDVLTQEQKDLMKIADPGTSISVIIHYLPNNALKNNDIKKEDFSFLVQPDRDASYPGGQQALFKYLKEKAIDKIPNGSFTGLDLTTVKFTINEDGEINDAHIFWPTEKKDIEALLLNAITNMPCWQPAAYANGLKVKQEYALTVGNMENCVVNLLGIRGE